MDLPDLGVAGLPGTSSELFLWPGTGAGVEELECELEALWAPGLTASFLWWPLLLLLLRPSSSPFSLGGVLLSPLSIMPPPF